MPRTSPGIRDIGLADWLFAKNQQFPWIDHCPASTKCVIEAAGMAERMRGDRLQPSYRGVAEREQRDDQQEARELAVEPPSLARLLGGLGGTDRKVAYLESENQY